MSLILQSLRGVLPLRFTSDIWPWFSQRGMWDSKLTSCNWCFFYHLLPKILVGNLQCSQKWNLQLRHFILVLFVSLDEQAFILPTSLKNDYRLLNQHKYFCILYIHCIMAPCNKLANKSNIDLMHAYVNTFFCKSVVSVFRTGHQSNSNILTIQAKDWQSLIGRIFKSR